MTKRLNLSIALATGLVSFSSVATYAQAPETATPVTTTLPVETSSISTSPVVSALENLKFGGVLEILAPAPLQNGLPDSDRARIRSFELTSQTSFDSMLPTLQAKATLGGYDAAGNLVVGLREGFVQANVVRTLQVRVGKYFLPIGLFNQTRRSAWVTPNAPEAVSRFFGDDGIVDSGLDLAWQPLQLFRLRAGVMNGYTFDAGQIGIGLKPNTPTHYLRATGDFGISASREMTVSLNYVGRIDDDARSTRITGLDFTLVPKAQAASARSWSGLGELLYREQKPFGLQSDRQLGGTLYFEKGLNERLSAGLRADALTIRSLVNTDGSKRSNLDWALVPVASYSLSKEMKLQAAYTYFKENRSGDSTRTEQSLEFRLVTELGTIPKFRGLPGDRSSL